MKERKESDLQTTPLASKNCFHMRKQKSGSKVLLFWVICATNDHHFGKEKCMQTYKTCCRSSYASLIQCPEGFTSPIFSSQNFVYLKWPYKNQHQVGLTVTSIPKFSNTSFQFVLQKVPCLKSSPSSAKCASQLKVGRVACWGVNSYSLPWLLKSEV